MTESSAVHSAPNQGPETNPEEPAEQPVHQWPVHHWPDSLTIHHLITELATKQAAAEMEKENPGFRFRASMYGASPDLGKSLRLAPGIDDAVAEAVRAYQPSDTLYDVLDQEMQELAETARDLLPREQWDRLRNAAKEHLRQNIQHRDAGA